MLEVIYRFVSIINSIAIIICCIMLLVNLKPFKADLLKDNSEGQNEIENVKESLKQAFPKYIDKKARNEKLIVILSIIISISLFILLLYNTVTGNNSLAIFQGEVAIIYLLVWKCAKEEYERLKYTKQLLNNPEANIQIEVDFDA